MQCDYYYERVDKCGTIHLFFVSSRRVSFWFSRSCSTLDRLPIGTIYQPIIIITTFIEASSTQKLTSRSNFCFFLLLFAASDSALKSTNFPVFPQIGCVHSVAIHVVVLLAISLSYSVGIPADYIAAAVKKKKSASPTEQKLLDDIELIRQMCRCDAKRTVVTAWTSATENCSSISKKIHLSSARASSSFRLWFYSSRHCPVQAN